MQYTKLIQSSGIVIAMAFLSMPLVSAAQTLDEIRSSGVFTIGYVPEQAPFSTRSAGGASGYSVELCQRVADATKAKLGLSELILKYTETTVESGLNMVANGQVDILCGAVNDTLSRRESVSFSLPIFNGGTDALLRVDAPIRLRSLMAGEEPEYRPRWRASYADILRQHSFSTISGADSEQWLMDSIRDFKLNVATSMVADVEEGVSQVINKQSDVFFADRALVEIELAKEGNAAGDVYLAGRGFTNVPIALAIQRGNDDLRLIADRMLSELYHSNKIAEIYTVFFGEPEEATRNLFRQSVLPE